MTMNFILGFMTFLILCRRSYSSWVKPVPFKTCIEFSNYIRSDYFKLVANCKINDNLELCFNPEIPLKLYREPKEWIYLFTVENYIVKIGGTRVGLRGRMSSYLSGRYASSSKTVSTTNAFVYNTLNHYLKLGHSVNLYAYELPKINLPPVNILNTTVKIKPQTYTAYESIFLEDFEKKYGIVPCLNYNWDPNYK